MDRLSYIISDEALDDIKDISKWYETKAIFLGSKFLHEFYNVSITKICTKPDSFLKLRRNGSIRRHIMNRFPYKVFYDNSTDPIKIIAIIHTSRSSHYIRRRLK